MKSQTQIQKREKISSSHRHLLVYVWKIHQGLRNGTSSDILRDYLEYAWNTELRDHFLNEEIFISSNIKHQHPVTEVFFHFHATFRKKVKEALMARNEEVRNDLENICILLIEMVRHEERFLKPYLKTIMPEALVGHYDEDDGASSQNFTPPFWNN